MIPETGPSTVTAVSLRRLALIAACVGAAMIVILTPFGYLGLALFGCLGVGLGLLNTALVQRAAGRFAASTDPHKTRRSAGNVLGRLALISLLAFAFAFLFRPEGLGVFIGLAVFQFVMVFAVALPLIKELRRTGVQA